ncbi:unnamed protein product, partial [Nippostrongylus brasiliensis]|uniref:Lysophospholipid acyltransferase 5 n=1 Tax=Nippostrongylus brasiliensis TaxID=27835 RepID=A0A0N4XU40_NIPBR
MVVGFLSRTLNIREDGLRLLLCVLAGYDVIHSYVVIFAAYLIVNLMTGMIESVVLAFVLFMGYLLVAYWFEESQNYDINWTTPFCVLVLRLIGLVINVYDGVHMDNLKPDQRKVAIKKVPCLLEIAAFSFFYTGTFAGPQFNLAKFRAYIKGNWLDEKKRPRDSAIPEAWNRFSAGIIYMFINIGGSAWLPDSYFNTPEFYNQTFFWRWTWAVIWSRIVLCRYCAMWLLIEGSAIYNGLGYNGMNSRGDIRWDGVRDIDIWKWETGHDFTSMVHSFNRGTNSWARNNIMRRLRWMDSKPLAQLTTLTFLAIWHGFHLGYFIMFGTEFACVMAQEQLYSLIRRSPEWSDFLRKDSVRPLVTVFGRIIIVYTTGSALLTFGLVTRKMWIGVLLVELVFLVLAAKVFGATLSRIGPLYPSSTSTKALKADRAGQGQYCPSGPGMPISPGIPGIPSKPGAPGLPGGPG